MKWIIPSIIKHFKTEAEFISRHAEGDLINISLPSSKKMAAIQQTICPITPTFSDLLKNRYCYNVHTSVEISTKSFKEDFLISGSVVTTCNYSRVFQTELGKYASQDLDAGVWMIDAFSRYFTF
jgi:hypothetical protein